MALLLFLSFVLFLIYFLGIFPQFVPLRYSFLSVLLCSQGYVLYLLNLHLNLECIERFEVPFLCDGRLFVLRLLFRRPLLNLNIFLRLFSDVRILLLYYYSNSVPCNGWLIYTKNYQTLLPWLYPLGCKQG